MLKQSITYVDFNGAKRTRDFFFHLSKAEVAKMELSQAGGMEAWVHRLINVDDRKTMIEIFDNFIRASVGEKSADGQSFIKSPEITEAFFQSEAYSVLFMELVQDAEKFAAFVNGLMALPGEQPNA